MTAPGGEGKRANQQPTQPSGSLPEVRTITNVRYSIVVPKTWTESHADGGLLLTPPGSSDASVQVFYEYDPSLSRLGMSEKTAGYLRSRDPGARVGRPQPALGFGGPAFKLHARGATATQTALGVLPGGYRYLVIENLTPGATRQMREQARRTMAGFKPR